MSDSRLQQIPSEWLKPGAVVPVTLETVQALLAALTSHAHTPPRALSSPGTGPEWDVLVRPPSAPPAAPPAQAVRMLTDAQIREWWASENGLEDCDLCKIDDFTQVVRAVEEKLSIGAAVAEPLTDEQINKAFALAYPPDMTPMQERRIIARALLAAHGGKPQ